MFISRAARKIHGLCSRKQTTLKTACEALIEAVDKHMGESMASKPANSDEVSFPVPTSEKDRQLLFAPFVLGCNSGQARIVDTALLALQQLIQHGYVTGRVRGNLYDQAADAKDRPHIDVIVGVACKCFEEVIDDSVQLQIIKAVLAAVSREVDGVHDAALINAVRTCYNIHLVSASVDNQATAKTALTQMINMVLKRMEKEAVDRESKEAANREGKEAEQRANAPDRPNDVPPVNGAGSEGDLGNAKEGANAEPPAQDGGPKAERQEEKTEGQEQKKGESDGEKGSSEEPVWDAKFIPGKFAVHVEAVAQDEDAKAKAGKAGKRKSEGEEQQQVFVVKGKLTLSGTTEPEFTEKHRLKLRELLGTAAHTPLTNITIAKVEPAESEGVVVHFELGCADHEAAGDTQMRLLEAVSDEASVLGGGRKPRGAGKREVDPNTLFQRDAFLLFRALCKMSMRQADTHVAYDLEIKSKMLSLELLLALLRAAGPAFCRYDRIVQGIRSNLTSSLLHNVAVNHPTVFSLSVSLFCTLTTRFRSFMKSEIQVFFQNILVRTVDSPHAAFHQKTSALEAAIELLRDPQLVMDLFVNYDCELDSVDILEQLTEALSRTAGRDHVAELGYAPKEDERVRALGVEGLVVLLHSTRTWAAMSDVPESKGKEADDGKDGGDDAEEESESDQKPPTPRVLSGKELKVERGRLVARFNIGAKDAIPTMVASGLVEHTPESIASFLRSTPGLSKTAVGEFIGKNKDFNVAVMHAYVESFNFRNMEFAASLRKFLEAFWLPGEAQVVDRIMEKWGAVYCKHNPSHFQSPDTAFVLAFSTIMLNTDLHSPSIKVKMTLPQFISTNRGINKTEEGKDCDLDPAFLTSIYEEIKQRKIKVTNEKGLDDEDAAAGGAGRSRHTLFLKETQALVRRSQEMVKMSRKQKRRLHTFVSCTDASHARTLFSACWCPMLAAFSIVLERCDDPAIVELALAGFAHAVHIAGKYFLTTERDAFVSSLAKFTCLASLKEMHPRNVEAIKTVLAVAATDGDALEDSWSHVIRTVSQVQRLQLMGMGAQSDAMLFDDPSQHAAAPARKGAQGTNHAPPQPNGLSDSNSSNAARASRSRVMGMGMGMGFSMGMAGLFGGRGAQGEGREEEAKLAEEQKVAWLKESVSEEMVDKVFADSQRLSNDGMVHFVTALCATSREELQGATPRIFSLQKLVEISYFNMDRGRLVWRRVWDVEGPHFVLAAQHKNPQVALYAIDSLRQLAHKFLEKEELGEYQFQQEFLRPFEEIIRTAPDRETQVMVLDCMSNLVRSRPRNVRSGWRSVLAVCAFAASVHDVSIVAHAFGIVCGALEEHAETVVGGFFVDSVNCLVAFAGNQVHDQVSAKAIEMVGDCAKRLGDADDDDNNNGDAHHHDGHDKGDEEGGGGGQGEKGRAKWSVRACARNERGTGLQVMVLDCMSNLVRSRPRNVRSGWRSVLAVCAFAASVHDVSIVAHAFGIVCGALEEHAETVVGGFFVDSVNCLVAFAGNQVHDQVSAKAIEMVGDCAKRLGEADDDDNNNNNNNGDAHHHDGHDKGEEEGGKEEAGKGKGLVRRYRLLSRGGAEEGDGEDVFIKVWFPLLTGLSRLASTDSRVNVRDSALSVLIATLTHHAHAFTPALWHLTLRGVLLPMFDDVRHARQSEWLDTTCLPAMRGVVALFATHYPKLRPMVPELFALVRACVGQESEGLVRIGFQCLGEFVGRVGGDEEGDKEGEEGKAKGEEGKAKGEGSRLGPEGWELVCGLLAELFETNMPFSTPLSRRGSKGSEESKGDGSESDQGKDDARKPREKPKGGAKGGRVQVDGGSFERVRCRCLAQLELLALCGDITTKHAAHLSRAHHDAVLDLVHRSFEFSSGFNRDIALRVQLQRAGLLQSVPNQLPSLLKQEVSAMATLVGACKHGMEQRGGRHADACEQRFVAFCREVLVQYTEKERHVASIPVTDRDIVRTEQHRELVAWTEVVVDMVAWLAAMGKGAVGNRALWKAPRAGGDAGQAGGGDAVAELMPLLLQLVACEAREVREGLRDLLLDFHSRHATL